MTTKLRNVYLRWEIQLFTNSKMENQTLHQSRGKVGKYDLTILHETLRGGKEPELTQMYPYIHYFCDFRTARPKEEKEWTFHKWRDSQHARQCRHPRPQCLQAAQTQPSLPACQHLLSLAPTLANNNFAFWGQLPAGTGGLFSYLTSLFCSLRWGPAAHKVNPGDELLSALTMGLLNRASPACWDRFPTIITLHKAPSLAQQFPSVTPNPFSLPLPKHIFDIPAVWPE